MVPRETANNAYAKFGGTNKEYYGIFQSGLYFFCNNALHFDLRDMPSEELLEGYCSILHSKNPSF